MMHSRDSRGHKPVFQIYWAVLWIAVLLNYLGCFQAAQIVDDEPVDVSAKLRPIDIDTAVALNIGREALEKIGYDEIVRLADRAHFVDYKADASIKLASAGSVVAAEFTPVFSRYALAAAVTAQADSPLPGPADVAAVGVIVLGLVDAGLLDGYVLNTIADWLAVAGPVFMTTGVTDTGVMLKVKELMAQAAAAGAPIDKCTALELLYTQASGLEKLKIQATQKGEGCRNRQKRK